MGKKLENKHANDYISWLKIHQPSIELISKYLSHKQKVSHLCLICGNTWDNSPKNIKRVPQPCPKCRINTKNKGLEAYTAEIASKFPDYEVLAKEYINNYTAILHRHKTCGYEYFIAPKDILKGRKCLKCTQRGRRTSEEDYRARIEGSDIELIDEYEGALKKVTHQCKICSKYFSMRPNNVLSGQACPYCAGHIKWTNSMYTEYLQGTDYINVEEYINSKTKILHKHIVCGYEWSITPSDIKGGHGCPNCAVTGFNQSKPATLYYICIDEKYYKIGITNKDVSARYSTEGVPFRVVWEYLFTSGRDAYELEKQIKSDYKSILGKVTEQVFKYTKNTELADYDFLHLE